MLSNEYGINVVSVNRQVKAGASREGRIVAGRDAQSLLIRRPTSLDRGEGGGGFANRGAIAPWMFHTLIHLVVKMGY